MRGKYDFDEVVDAGEVVVDAVEVRVDVHRGPRQVHQPRPDLRERLRVTEVPRSYVNAPPPWIAIGF